MQKCDLGSLIPRLSRTRASWLGAWLGFGARVATSTHHARSSTRGAQMPVCTGAHGSNGLRREATVRLLLLCSPASNPNPIASTQARTVATAGVFTTAIMIGGLPSAWTKSVACPWCSARPPDGRARPPTARCAAWRWFCTSAAPCRCLRPCALDPHARHRQLRRRRRRRRLPLWRGGPSAESPMPRRGGPLWYHASSAESTLDAARSAVLSMTAAAPLCRRREL